MYCPKCGRKITQDEKFCGNCGAKLDNYDLVDVEDVGKKKGALDINGLIAEEKSDNCKEITKEKYFDTSKGNNINLLKLAVVLLIVILICSGTLWLKLRKSGISSGSSLNTNKSVADNSLQNPKEKVNTDSNAPEVLADYWYKFYSDANAAYYVSKNVEYSDEEKEIVLEISSEYYDKSKESVLTEYLYTNSVKASPDITKVVECVMGDFAEEDLVKLNEFHKRALQKILEIKHDDSKLCNIVSKLIAHAE